MGCRLLALVLLLVPACAIVPGLLVAPLPTAGTRNAVEPFLTRFEEYRTSDRHRSTRDLVERFPDRTLATLRELAFAHPTHPAGSALANLHAEYNRGGDVWMQRLRHRSDDPRQIAWLSARRRVLAALDGGRPGEAIEWIRREAPGSGDGLLWVDSLWLTAEALRAEGRRADAAQALDQAARRAEGVAPYLALVLRSEWLELAQDPAVARIWTETARAAGRSIVCDPSLWERLVATRPVGASWPREALMALARSAPDVVPVPAGYLAEGGAAMLSDGLAEGIVLAVVGRWYFDRDEPRLAVEAFRRAEATGLPDGLDRLRLARARALLQLGLGGTAEPLLLRLSRDPEHPLAPPALALLGAVRLAEGNTEPGRILFRRAIEEYPNHDWPGRARTEADLGLVLLAKGDVRGRAMLEAARERCLRAEDWPGFVLCIEAEANYHEWNSAPHLARRLREQWLALERKSAP